MARPRHLVLAALGALALLVPAACRKPSAGEVAADASAPPELAKVDDGEGGPSPSAEESVVDAGNRFRDAEPKVVVDPDGPIDPACSGSDIALAVAVVDKRCAVGSARAKQLRAMLEHDGGGDAHLPLRQEAKVGADGRVVLRLLNTGSASLTLPLSFSAKLPAFTVLAEDDRHSLYELEPPRLDVAAGSPEAAAANDRPHFARIVLAPGGAAVASVVISSAIVRVVGRGPEAGAGTEKCADGGSCARLPKGRYTLHVGELLTDVEAGPPARVVLELP
jgi:hypothetical protein